MKGVVGRFKDDGRVQVWDIWNEPDNDNANSYGRNNRKEEPDDKLARTMELLPLAFEWARSAESVPAADVRALEGISGSSIRRLRAASARSNPT